MPSGTLPVWIQKDKFVSDEQILELIKSKYLQDYNDITLFYNVTRLRDKDRVTKIKNWCEANAWNCLQNYDIYGSESQIVIMYELLLNLESMSRARNGLIFVTTDG